MTTDKKDDATPVEPEQPGSGSAATGAATPPPSPALSAPPTDSAKPKPDAKAAGAVPPPVATRSSRTGLWILWLLLAIAVAGLAYAGWTQMRTHTMAQEQLAAELARQGQRWQAIQNDIQHTLSQMDNRQREQQSGWTESLQGVEKRLEEHSRRLRSLSTTTREDWLLAEVEYLLRLANQRLQMERGTVGALGLLQAADQILLELDDSELFAVRDKLARDITALRLTPSVDRSGLYLQLAALAEQIEQLPEVPRMAVITAGEAEQAEADATTAAAAEIGFIDALQAHFRAAMDKLRHQVRIRHSEQALEPLLPPAETRYVRQNIRFNLEQAQLAMLREETAIYRHSLQQAEQLLRRYFALQPAALLIADQLQELAQNEVVVKLPSISGSLNALQDHIRTLHLLDDRAGRPQLDSQQPAQDQSQQSQQRSQQQSQQQSQPQSPPRSQEQPQEAQQP